jgi:hypothetical protein
VRDGKSFFLLQADWFTEWEYRSALGTGSQKRIEIYLQMAETIERIVAGTEGDYERDDVLGIKVSEEPWLEQQRLRCGDILEQSELESRQPNPEEKAALLAIASEIRKEVTRADVGKGQ